METVPILDGWRAGTGGGGGMFRLDGKVALVTGAGFGMGAGVARAFARQGARVVVNDIDPARASGVAERLVGDGFQATAMAFDVTSNAAVTEAAARVAREVGQVDILVNNAGNAGAGHFAQKPFAETLPEDWQPFIAVNLMGVLYCTRAMLPGMCARGWGRVITISSDAGRRGMAINVSVYGAAKAAAAHFMRHLCQEVGKHGVTANVISLGFMNTISDTFTQKLLPDIPMGRVGTPDGCRRRRRLSGVRQRPAG